MGAVRASLYARPWDAHRLYARTGFFSFLLSTQQSQPQCDCIGERALQTFRPAMQHKSCSAAVCTRSLCALGPCLMTAACCLGADLARHIWCTFSPRRILWQTWQCLAAKRVVVYGGRAFPSGMCYDCPISSVCCIKQEQPCTLCLSCPVCCCWMALFCAGPRCGTKGP